MTAIEAPARAGRREWIGMAVLALACVLYVMDLTVLYLALPAISADLEPTSDEHKPRSEPAAGYGCS